MTSQLDPVFPDQDIDLAVMIGQPLPGRVYYQYLFSPTMFPVCSPKLIAGRHRIKCPSDLSGFTILQVYPSAGDWAAWLEATGAERVDPDGGLRFDSYDHALRMAARGLGVALATQPYVREDMDAGLLTAPLPRHTVPAPGDWYLVYMAEHRTLRKSRHSRPGYSRRSAPTIVLHPCVARILRISIYSCIRQICHLSVATGVCQRAHHIE